MEVQLASVRSPLTEVRRSGIAGRGVFALTDIPAGTVVAIKAGHLLDRAALKLIGDLAIHAALRVTATHWLAPLTEAEAELTMTFFNHSCSPNVGMQGSMIAVTMRPIKAGEELTLDYAMFQDDEEFDLTCQCRSPRCRRRLTGRDWRHAALQERYAGFFSAYIQGRIDRGE